MLSTSKRYQDSEWLADLLRHGLLRPSFLPPPPIRVLRDLTRYRKSLVELRTQEINRVHKVLETANIKLGAVASNVVGVSERRMLEAIRYGEVEPQVLAELAKGRLREKLPALRLALDGRVQAHHQLLLGELLDHLDYLDRAIHRMEVDIAALVAREAKAVDLLLTLPATGPVTAAAIIAEIGTDQRIARRRGKPRAMMAVAHSLLVSIYYMLRDQVPYQELGPDYFDQLHTHQLERHYVRRLEALGFQVTLTSAS